MNFYNNKKHRLIGMSPNEADNIRDEETIKKINEIKNREFEKINKKRSYLENNNTCLLNLKFLLIWKNTLILNFEKKQKFKKKQVKIIKNNSFDYYFIKICSIFIKRKSSFKEVEKINLIQNY